MTRNPPFSIVPSKNFPDRKGLVHQLCKIDKICYGKIAKQDQGTENYWEKICSASLSYVVLDKNKIIGYIDFLKITEAGFEIIKMGKIHDGELEPLLDFSDGKELNLYLSSVCLLPSYRKKGLAKLLWQASWESFKENGLVIKNIVAVIWTEEGAHFLKNITNKRLSRDPYGHPVVLLRP